MMLYDFLAGLSARECSDKMRMVLGQHVPPTLETVRSRFARFGEGDYSLVDRRRTGRPPSAITPRAVRRIRRTLEADPHCTYEQIRVLTGLGNSTIQTIIHDQLNMRKICSRWVPHVLTEANRDARMAFCRDMKQRFADGRSDELNFVITGDETWLYCYDPLTRRQSRAWVARGERAPVVPRRAAYTKKVMVAVFFGVDGIKLTVPLERNATINAEWYSENCMTRLADTVATRPLLLHHDNARPHTALTTQDTIRNLGLQILPHPPYSPDLAPADFFLFPKVKRELKGEYFRNTDAVLEKFNTLVAAITPDEWRSCFHNWFQRMDKCLAMNGEYFENMWWGS